VRLFVQGDFWCSLAHGRWTVFNARRLRRAADIGEVHVIWGKRDVLLGVNSNLLIPLIEL
jgi:hypothetical protein